MNKGNGFLKSDVGRILIAVVLYVILWGVLYGICVSGGALEDFAPIIGFAICGIVGWKSVTRIQPAIFLILPIGGWVVYIVVKFLVSVVVGLFVAPYKISGKICSRL